MHLFVVQRDGSVEEHDDTILRANTTSGVDDIAQRYVWFNKDIEQIGLLKAETIDPDGTVHPVGPDGIRDVQEPPVRRRADVPERRAQNRDFSWRRPRFRGCIIAFTKTRKMPLQTGTFGLFCGGRRAARSSTSG